MVRTSSSSRGFVSWSLSNVVSPALTRVVLSVRPQERKGENQGQGLGANTFMYTEWGTTATLTFPYRFCPAVLRHIWSFPTVCKVRDMWYNYWKNYTLVVHPRFSTPLMYTKEMAPKREGS